MPLALPGRTKDAVIEETASSPFPDLFDERWGERLASLAFDPSLLARVDPLERRYFRLDCRRRGDGGFFLQYRFLLGTEGRSERALVDTPLAGQPGLRSTNLQFRA